MARKSEGAEAMGAQRCLRDVSGNQQGPIVLAGERKERSLVLLNSEPEAPLALLIAPDGAQQINAPEGGPVGVTKIVLAVGALPEQEAA